MALTAGARLGPYEVVSPVGAGGMGEVYRARDTRLERTVAIKVLSAALTASAEVKMRFEREARTISSLNHPNICALYDVGSENGTDFLVMEFIEGETLADVLKRGPLDIGRALEIALQIADALEKAHRSGIVHRDLKPGNIMLTKSGAKLMDFGLAKPVGAMATAASGVTASPLFSAAVTRSSPASPLTSVGSIVGTVQYMSPEQVEGRESDARADIFAFGLVLYEMVGGRRAFDGKTQASVVASILALDPPPLSSVRPTTPAPLDKIVRICLAKDPDERFQTAHDLKLQLEALAEMDLARAQVTAAPKRERIAWLLTGVFLLAAVSAGAWAWKTSNAPRPIVRGSLLPPTGGVYSTFNLAQVSPDGRYVVYGASVNGVAQLWLQALDSEVPQPMSGTEGAAYPFWSADSRSVGFFAGNRLKRAEVGGGPAQTICDVVDGRGGSWSANGTIIFGARLTPIMKVSAAGGQAAAVTELDRSKSQGTHRWPYFLPDGKTFLFMTGVTGNDNPRNEIYIGSLDSKESHKLIAASSNVVYANGYILYRRETSLMAQPFDPKANTVTGDAVPIVEQIRFDPGTSVGNFSASTNGVLVFQHGLGSSGAQQLNWLDLTGKRLGSALEPNTAYSFRLSPDNKFAAVSVVDSGGNVDIWIYDLVRSVKSRLTFDPGREYEPAWSPDGKKVYYSSEREQGRGQLWAKNADGSGQEERLLQSQDYDIPDHVTPDGKELVFTRRAVGSTNADIMRLPLTGERKPHVYLQTTFNEYSGNVSPNQHWLAYTSDESGRFEIYVSTFPTAGGKWQISSGGGREPVWDYTGKRLFYYSPDNDLMMVEIAATASSIQPGVPKKLLASSPAPGRKTFDVGKNGNILVNGFAGDKTASQPLSFTVNWPATVRK